MRDRRESRNISPAYGHSSRHMDCHGDNVRHHMTASRRPGISRSPPLCNRQRRQSRERSGVRPPRLDHGSRVNQDFASQYHSKHIHSPPDQQVNQDYVSQYHPRHRHSPPDQHCCHDLHANHIDMSHRTELSPELEFQPMVTQKFDSMDYGPGRSQPATQKQESLPTGGTHHMGLYCRHLQDPCDEDRNRRANRNISPKYGHNRHDSVILAKHIDCPGDTASHHMAVSRQPQISLGPPLCNHRLRQSPERSDFRPRRLDLDNQVNQDYIPKNQSRHEHSPPVQHRHQDLHANYRDLNHCNELSLEIDNQPLVTQKSDSLDYVSGRTQSATQKQESFLTSGTRRMGLFCRHLQDPCDEDRGRATERAMVLRQRELCHSGTIESSHLRLVEGGSSPYQHSRLHYEPRCVSQDDIPRVTRPHSPDHLLRGRQSRYWVDDRYEDIVGDDVHKKVPHPSSDYSIADGTTCSSRSVREGKVSTDLLNHSRLTDLGHLPRLLRRPRMQTDGYKSDTDGAISQRERIKNSFFSDSGKGLRNAFYSPPCDENIDAMEHETTHVPVRGNKYHVHLVSNCDEMSDRVDTDYDTHNIDVAYVNSDAEDGEYKDGYNQRRAPVHDRLSLPSPPNTGYKSYPLKDRLGKPCPMYSHCYDPNTMVDTTTVLHNSVKKRQCPYPSDFTRKNSHANKFQKSGFEDNFKPNARDLNYGSTKGSYKDATDGGFPVKDPPEGSAVFNRQVERAFLTYVREINDSVWEKKKFLEPWKGSIHCYVCGRQSSKEFAETHDLVMHTFYTQKPGLKTAHRGLHKALCLSFGWNWCVAPDKSKLYQVGPLNEAEELKGELILWPPIVVIRNSSVESKASNSKVVSLEAIECMLEGIIGKGKAKLSLGKPSDQSVILVKFPPLYSGFELADKLHNKFAQSNHGKDHLEFFLKSCSDAIINKKAKEIENEDVLYGYMAVIEDLDKLDSVTKKMYKGQKDILKSRKDIAAAAARLNKHSAG